AAGSTWPRANPPGRLFIMLAMARATTAAASTEAPAAPGVARRRARARRRRAAKLFRYDRSLGTRFVAGAGEAGRGSLAGPEVAAAAAVAAGTLERCMSGVAGA